MKNILKLIIVAVFIVSCTSTNNSSNNIGGMTLEQFAKSDKFITFTDEEVNKALNTSLEDSTAENREIIIKTKSSLYRFYRKCVYNEGILDINVKNGKEIQISENIFSAIKKHVDATNESIREYPTKNPTTKLVTDGTFFTEEGLEELLK